MKIMLDLPEGTRAVQFVLLIDEGDYYQMFSRGISAPKDGAKYKITRFSLNGDYAMEDGDDTT